MVVDPLPVVRSGLSLLIRSEADLTVAGEASTADEALEVLRRVVRRAGVLALVALNLDGDHDGYWLIREIRETYPDVAVLACGAHSDDASVFRALFSGADGFVDKTARPEKFLEAIRRGAARGDLVLEGLPPDWLAPFAAKIARHRDKESRLTDREKQVLAVAAEGLTARQIGSRLSVSERTVTTHLFRIYKKLETNNRVGAIAAAARSGLITIGSP
ncbi:MAG: LuxR C-terminal-related transcriptional regulator [Actinomycetota bacterium]